MTTPLLNTIGLLLTILGVLGLFRFGMPFHVPTGGATYLILETIDESEKAKEQSYSRLGYLFLAMVAFGTAFQIWASWN